MPRFPSRFLARCSGLLFSASLLATICATQAAEPPSEFPSRPVRIVVPYGAGGAADLLARTLAGKLTQLWSQPVLVENKPGGVGTVGILSVIGSPPDGYTLASVPVSDLAVNPHLYKKRRFNVLTDLAPVSQVGAVPNVLIASPGFAAKDANDLIAVAKSRPGRITFSSPGLGSQAHIVGEQFARATGIQLLHVPYNSMGAAMTDVAGNQVDIMFAQLPAALPFIKSGKVRAFGMVSEQRSELYPEMPTLKELTGRSLGDAISWSGLMAPANTPLELREKIAADVTRAMRSEDVRQSLSQQGTVGLGGTPAELKRAIDTDYQRYGAVIRELHLQLD